MPISVCIGSCIECVDMKFIRLHNIKNSVFGRGY